MAFLSNWQLFFIFELHYFKLQGIIMSPLIKNILYGIGVFSLFSVIALLLKFATNYTPIGNEVLGYFTTSDLMLGVVVAIVVTLAHVRKTGLK